MKRLIFLKVEDYNPSDKKMKADELENAKAKVLTFSIKAFRDGIKENKSIKIIQELSKLPQIIVEFSEAEYYEVHDTLRSIKVVEIIDSILPLEAQEDRPKEKSQKKNKELDLSKFMK